MLCFKSIYNMPITFPPPPPKNDGKLEIQLPGCFSCFFGYSYDLRLYTGNVDDAHTYIFIYLFVMFCCCCVFFFLGGGGAKHYSGGGRILEWVYNVHTTIVCFTRKCVKLEVV